MFLALLWTAGQARETNAEEPASKPATQKADETPPAFSSLKEAVAFIAACLDKEDYDKLADACSGKRSHPEKYLLEILKKMHQDTPLAKLYAEKEFPKDKTAFKLGGHMSELKCIHIDFAKKDDKWMLDSIWMCK
ncbi:MAG: hypothetical protein HZA50_14330 [Planctomycetes bacterium]|nr:hypothetical protein [Planctomycetota bacterium]